MIEAISAEDEKRAQLLARVAAHGSFPTRQDAHRQQDLATYIHDLARLGTDDIRMLRTRKSFLSSGSSSDCVNKNPVSVSVHS